MRAAPWLLEITLFVSFGAMGCSATVGHECTPDDEARARTIVYRRSGSPAYVGQALLLTSCGTGSFCHTEGVTTRYGVPFDLNFDAQLADAFTDSRAGAARLHRIQATIFHHRNDIYDAVLRGAMPPGALGERVDQQSTNPYLVYADDMDTMGTPIAAVRTAAGREALRNWLACGAPVVERTMDVTPTLCRSNADCTVTHLCDAVLGECAAVGATVAQRPTTTMPIWSEIHPQIIVPSCVAGCHVAGGLRPQLDFSDLEAARTALVAMTSATAGCGTLVTAGDPDASLLVAKLENTQPTGCGAPMPYMGAELTSPQISIIRMWISNGANDD